MARISAIYFSRHCQSAIIFYFSVTATCTTFFNSRQWRGGAKSGASAQHWRFLYRIGVTIMIGYGTAHTYLKQFTVDIGQLLVVRYRLITRLMLHHQYRYCKVYCTWNMYVCRFIWPSTLLGSKNYGLGWMSDSWVQKSQAPERD